MQVDKSKGAAPRSRAREPQLSVRRGSSRGLSDHGWLRSLHTFSFGDYYDPERMGFRALRVINEDRLDARRGFPPHAHHDMEIVSLVLAGELEHRDSMGNGSVIRPGELQRLSAGTGVAHSEYNHSSTASVHFLQIWILPERQGSMPSYEQRTFAPSGREGKLQVMASRDGREGSMTVHQDVRLLGATVRPGDRVALEVAAGRHAWVQVLRGTVSLNGVRLDAGDGASTASPGTLAFTSDTRGEVLLFDLA